MGKGGGWAGYIKVGVSLEAREGSIHSPTPSPPAPRPPQVTRCMSCDLDTPLELGVPIKPLELANPPKAEP